VQVADAEDAGEAPAEDAEAEDEAGDESTDETEEPPPADPDITQLSLF
jgi:hypothetical protein